MKDWFSFFHNIYVSVNTELGYSKGWEYEREEEIELAGKK